MPLEDVKLIYLFVIILTLTLNLTLVGAQNPTVIVDWIQSSDPSPEDDYAYSVCSWGDYIYVVGFDESPGDGQFRIEKRLKTDGSLVKVWRYNPSRGRDELRDCVVVGDRLYVVGHDDRPGDREWAILMFDMDLNLITYATSNPTADYDYAQAVASDGQFLYVTGYQFGEWRVEKRRLSDLALVKAYVSDPSEGWDETYGIGINPRTGEVWVVGDYRVEDAGYRTRIEILDRDLNIVRSVNFPDFYAPNTMIFDETGNAYVIDWSYILKLNRYGVKMETIVGLGGIKALYINTTLYICDTLLLGGKEYPVIYTVDSRTLTPKTMNILEYKPEIDAWVRRGRMAFDGRKIYLVVNDNRTGSYGYVIYSLIPVDAKTLLDNYNTLKIEHGNLQSKYEKLSGEYKSLEKEYNILADKYYNLRLEYDSLLLRYQSLFQDHDTLKFRFNILATVLIFISLIFALTLVRSHYMKRKETIVREKDHDRQISLLRELEKLQEALKKLEELKASGQVTDVTYYALKEEYTREIERIKREIGGQRNL